MNALEVLRRLEGLANPEAAAGMERFGISPKQTFGVSIPNLRRLAKEIGKDHGLALRLWQHDIRETRILAGMIDDPRQVTEEQMERWAADFDYWEICDQVCGNLFDKTPFAFSKAVEWSRRSEEYVKRAGFAIVAWSAVHSKGAGDEVFEGFLPIIIRESQDNRKMVRKAVNWALRQIGKRSERLNRQAVSAAEKILETGSKSGRWIAKDALRELKSEAVQKRLKKRSQKS